MTIEILERPERQSYPPRVTDFTRPYWDALVQGQVLCTHCRSCGHETFPPKPICPRCWHAEIDWVPAQTSGVLYSWTRVHAAPNVFLKEVPYCVGIVDLDGGMRVACRLVDPNTDDYKIGEHMMLVVIRFADGPLLAARRRPE